MLTIVVGCAAVSDDRIIHTLAQAEDVYVDAAVRAPNASRAAKEQLTGVFHSANDLGDWHEYFDSVYGVHTMKFPFDLGSLNFFYEDRLPRRIRSSLRVRGDENQRTSHSWGWNDAISGGPLVKGDLYRMFNKDHVFRCELDICSTDSVDSACRAGGFVGTACNKNGSATTLARYTPFRRSATNRAAGGIRMPGAVTSLYLKASGVPNNTLVEVIHSAGDPPGMGFWFYYAKGSGVYYDVGETLAFSTHGEAYEHFLSYLKANPTGAGAEESLTAAASRMGIQTLQFTRFAEGGLVKTELMLAEENTHEDRIRNDDLFHKIFAIPMEWLFGIHLGNSLALGNVCPRPQFLKHFSHGYGGVHGNCECDVDDSYHDFSCAAKKAKEAAADLRSRQAGVRPPLAPSHETQKAR